MPRIRRCAERTSSRCATWRPVLKRAHACGQFSRDVPPSAGEPVGFEETTCFGGIRGASRISTERRQPTGAAVPPKPVTGADAIVFGRSNCFFSTTIDGRQR